MASDNNNIKSLAADAPESDTSELEVLSVDLIPTDEELEMDADTFSLDERPVPVGSVESLRSDLRSRDERISSLQFDIEQLHARWTGLEKEIEAREELTSMLQADLKAAHKSLRSKEREIGQLNRRIDSLTNDLDTATRPDEERATLEHEIDALREDRRDDAAKIEALETELEAIRAEAQHSARRESDDAVSTGEGALRQQRRIDELEAGERTLEANLGRLDAMLKVARSENADLKTRLSKAKERIRDYTHGEARELTALVQTQHGEIVGQRDRVQILETELTRTEAYADGLRRKLDDASEQRASAESTLVGTRDERDAARYRVDELETQLEAAERTAADLQARLEERETSFKQEISVLRYELGEAQETITSQESLNEQLAGNLLDHENTQRSLSSKLAEVESNRGAEIDQLSKQVDDLRVALDDADDKIANKDNAISALLNELANKSRSIESIGEIESVIHDIDGRMSERIDDDSGERERPTRLLVGTVEGQELRFPLFKDRLTIGRTSQNDIQLRAQYISRRHAVLIVEDDITRIVDWGSKNGVYVNSARVAEEVLSNGDKISIGAAEFVFEERARRDGS